MTTNIVSVGVFATFAALFALEVQGAIYYWKGVNYVNKNFDPSAGYGKWSELSNWSTNGYDGADAMALPSNTDTLKVYVDNGVDNKGTDNVWRQFDLEDSEWSVGGWYSGDDWRRHYWRFTNGSLHWSGSHSTHSDTVHLDDGANFFFDEGSYYNASYNHASSDE